MANTHKTMLAGVGVYDSTREIAADSFDRLFVSGSELVNELLEKGETVEAELYAKLEGRKMLKEKFSKLKAKLGFGHTGRDQQLEMLNQRVDSLIDVVAKLAQQQAAEQKAPAKPAKAKASKTTAKPAAKAKADKTPAKTADKPAAKAKAPKAPAKTATKPASKAKAAKTPAKAAAKPADKPAAKATVKTVDNNTTAKADSDISAKD